MLKMIGPNLVLSRLVNNISALFVDCVCVFMCVRARKRECFHCVFVCLVSFSFEKFGGSFLCLCSLISSATVVMKRGKLQSWCFCFNKEKAFQREGSCKQRKMLQTKRVNTKSVAFCVHTRTNNKEVLQ